MICPLNFASLLLSASSLTSHQLLVALGYLILSLVHIWLGVVTLVGMIGLSCLTLVAERAMAMKI